MVSRNRYGRYDVEARDADAPSPWSEDQATTRYLSGHLRAVPGVPPLPERFAESEHAHDGGFEDEPTQWHDDLVSWDDTPPRASGVARVQPSAAQHPRPGMQAYAAEPELDEPEDWAAELDAQLEAATQPDALAAEQAWGAHAGPANAPLEVEAVTQAHDPYAWEPTTAYVPSELEENPWAEEPNVHGGELSQLYAADPGAWELAPSSPTRQSRRRSWPTTP